MSDGDGTTFSIDRPDGLVVTSKAEAELYVKKGGIGYTHSYVTATLHDTAYDAIKSLYGEKCAIKNYGKR